MQERRAIAIDGPVAVGKTVVGRLLARRLGFRFLDTGVMYRAVTLAALERAMPLEDDAGLTRLAEEIAIEVLETDAGHQVIVDGADVTGRLRTPDVEHGASVVSQVPGVREALVRKQRAMADAGRWVVVGRDIGTVVLPDVEVKLFLEASVEERARRRYEELHAKGANVDADVVRSELEERDQRDIHRAHSPLRAAPDARRVVTDGLTVEQVVDHIITIVGAEARRG